VGRTSGRYCVLLPSRLSGGNPRLALASVRKLAGRLVITLGQSLGTFHPLGEWWDGLASVRVPLAVWICRHVLVSTASSTVVLVHGALPIQIVSGQRIQA
jgi:hypothetical protein